MLSFKPVSRPLLSYILQVGEQWYNLRPDALAAYRVGSQQFRFRLEWDRGTMKARDPAIKFDAYAHYIASREWARESSRLPVLVCVAPDIAQERRLHRAARAGLSSLPGFVLWTAADVLLKEHGPLASIWLRDVPRRGPLAPSGGPLRQHWQTVVSGK